MGALTYYAVTNALHNMILSKTPTEKGCLQEPSERTEENPEVDVGASDAYNAPSSERSRLHRAAVVGAAGTAFHTIRYHMRHAAQKPTRAVCGSTWPRLLDKPHLSARVCAYKHAVGLASLRRMRRRWITAIRSSKGD